MKNLSLEKNSISFVTKPASKGFENEKNKETLTVRIIELLRFLLLHIPTHPGDLLVRTSVVARRPSTGPFRLVVTTGAGCEVLPWFTLSFAVRLKIVRQPVRQTPQLLATQ